MEKLSKKQSMVLELNANELSSIGGGWFGVLLLGAAIGLALQEINDRDNSDFHEGREAARNFW